ncbi:MAG: transglycosylase domain-containing protein [Desulfomonile tiedjei]|uniref:Transglycosylase domain-containing protein n=1 Tax=Desulfomonile tiedjei TaxID=2358 RepID=A0A9D6YZV5_9BACT|nr:transglycosylase domain-containing protein [Desulfomonile tiedjei]
MGKSSRRIALAAFTFLVGVLIYFAWVIYSAREYTANTLLPAYRATPYPLAVSDLSPRQIEILLKVEDPHFFEHRGVDLSTPGAGITTITQALVKHLYFEKFSPGIAKLKQTVIARFALDPLMAKNDQLRLFINTAYLGPNASGFAQAAELFFGKPFAQLNEDEYVALVAMLIAPTTFDIKRYPERNHERVERIKRVVSGEYVPRGLFDVFYGKLEKDIQRNIPPLSYFESYYQ